MNPFHIKVEVPVLKLEAKQQEWNGEISKFHKFSKAEINGGCSQPKNESHQFQLRIDHLLEEEVKRKGIGKAEGEFRECWLEQVPIDIKGEVPVIISDEGVNKRELVN